MIIPKGTKVKIKSLDWFYENCGKDEYVVGPEETKGNSVDMCFSLTMTQYCGKIMTIQYGSLAHPYSSGRRILRTPAYITTEEGTLWYFHPWMFDIVSDVQLDIF
jgi:hypothetical protein